MKPAHRRARSGQSELRASRRPRQRLRLRSVGQAPRRHIPGSIRSANGRCATSGLDRLDAFFRAWELAGNYPAILDDEVVGESARSLFNDAQAMLDQIIAERWVTPRRPSAFGAASARATTCSSSPATTGPAPFLRQQVKKREGRANMSLADFINPEGEDWIGGFAVGIHGLEPHLERSRKPMTTIRTSC
jgi:5-methyltetrahydrofolate--homocysteine methyltransferase